VYLDELVLRLTCQDDGMKFAGGDPREQSLHLFRDALGTPNARPFIVDVLKNDPMQLASASSEQDLPAAIQSCKLTTAL
jgi:hypothetical protein